MARKRPAVHCRANRTNGEPCRAWAIVGGTVCWAHGGAASQVQHAAYVALVEARLRRAFAHDWARLEHEVREWQIRRYVFAAMALNIPVEQVDEAAIWWAYSEAGRRSEPRPVIRHDRRFKSPQPPARKPRRPNPNELQPSPATRTRQESMQCP